MANKKNENFDKLKKYIKNHPLKTSLLVIGTLYLSGLISLGVNVLINLPRILAKEMENPFTLNPFLLFKDMFTSVRGYIILFLIIVLEIYIWNFVLKPRFKQKTGTDDERGFTYADKGIYGDSRLVYADTVSEVFNEEFENILKVDTVDSVEGDILGKPVNIDTSNVKKDTDEKIKNKINVITVPSSKEYDQKAKQEKWPIDDIVNNKLNNHKAIFGASGTMKSRAVARNFIMQAAKRGESIVITDPKGELYEDCAIYLKNKGYDVKMFNLVNQKYSDSWNCLEEIYNKDGTVDVTSAKIFADTIVTNASGESDYWSDNARNLLKAVCILVAEDPYLPTNIGTVYDIISQKTPAEIDALFKNLDPDNVARRAYSIFGVCTDQVKGQIANGLGIMLDVFQDENIRNITSSHEIDLTKPATEKCAYFCITSDQHSVFDFLAVLFYAMMFIKLVETIDSSREVGHEGMGSTIPVNLILDEFPNIGQIPAFCKKISTVRSRNINITVIFQNIVQMQNRYPYGQWEEILGNCDTTIFLGCTDQTTADYIAGKTGVTSIEVTTQNSAYQRDVVVFNQSTDYHEVSSTGQRKVMNADEVLRLRNTEELIFLRGHKPLKAKKYDYSLHPDAMLLKPMAIKDHIPDWKQKQIDERRKKEEARLKILQENERKDQEEQEKLKQQGNKEEDLVELQNAINNPFSSLANTGPKKAPKKINNSPFGRNINNDAQKDEIKEQGKKVKLDEKPKQDYIDELDEIDLEDFDDYNDD